MVRDARAYGNSASSNWMMAPREALVIAAIAGRAAAREAVGVNTIPAADMVPRAAGGSWRALENAVEQH